MILAWVLEFHVLLFSFKGTSSPPVMDSGRTLFPNPPSYQAIFSCREDKEKANNELRGYLENWCPNGCWFPICQRTNSLASALSGEFLNPHGTVLISTQVHNALLSVTLKAVSHGILWNPGSSGVLYPSQSCSYSKEIWVHMLAKFPQDTGTRKLHFSLLRIFLNFIIKSL